MRSIDNAMLILTVTPLKPTEGFLVYETDLPAFQTNTETSARFSCPHEIQSRSRNTCTPTTTRAQALAPERRRETLRTPYAGVTPWRKHAISPKNLCVGVGAESLGIRRIDDAGHRRSARHDRINTISSRSSCAISLRSPARILGSEKEHIDLISRLKKRLSKCGTKVMLRQ
jgi:hypothetical protein